MAKRFFIVSLKVSPLDKLLDDAEKLIESADNLFSARSKDILVLVEFSKNKFTIVLPLSVGTFLTGLSNTSRKEKAVSRMIEISSAGTPSSPIKFCMLKFIYYLYFIQFFQPIECCLHYHIL